MQRLSSSAWVLVVLASATGCETSIGQRADAAVLDATADVASRVDASALTDDTGPEEPDAGAPDASGPDAAVMGTDDAAITNAVFPRALGCTARTEALVTVQNTGTTTWTGELGYGLEAVDYDVLHADGTRVTLAAGETVAPGETHDFAVPLAAPGAASHVVTDWRMTRDGGPAFGATASQDINVYCETFTPADFDLAAVTIVSSPEVRDFAVTSSITSLSFSPGTIHVDHTLRGTWPPVVIAPDGTEQEATIWVFFHIGGTWYATGGERLRPSQTDKELSNPSSIGPGWLYDPGRWGIMTGYVPSPGDLVGFMVVAGSTRSDDHVIARERTGVVLVPFPSDGVTTTFPPFAWQE